MKLPFSCQCGGVALALCRNDFIRAGLLVVALVVFCFAAAVAVVPLRAEAASSGCHQPGSDPEVLVLTTATRLPHLCDRRAVEIQNLGPNPIYCSLGYSSMARVGKSRKIGAGETWAIEATDVLPIWCIAATASQVTGAATIVSEIK